MEEGRDEGDWYDLAGAIYLANLDWADPVSISKL